MSKKGHEHKMKKKLTKKEIKAANHLKLMQGKGKDNITVAHQATDQNYKKAA